VKAAPRITIASSSKSNGTCSAFAIAANARGKPVNITVTTRISQT
jgi:hypothetical protein